MTEKEFTIPNFTDRWDKDLKITLYKDTEKEDVLHLFVRGRIDTYNAEFFQSRLDAILEFGLVKLIFRCSSLNYVSSSGLGVLVTEHQKFAQKGGIFIFTEMQPKVMEIFQLLGFNHLFCIAKDMADAKSFLRSESLARKDFFPTSFQCPICEKRLTAKKSGRFRCSNCKSVIDVSENGTVSF